VIEKSCPFVNQSTPREVPYEIFRKVTPWGSLIIWNFHLSALIVIALFSFIYFVFEINIVFLYVLGFVFIASSAVIYMKSRRAMRLLKEGLFTTGHIRFRDDFSSFSKYKQESSGYDRIHIAKFTDQSGSNREASIIAAANAGWLVKLLLDARPVGLLYLPGTNAVIVTDLWLDAYPELSLAKKRERKKAEEAAYQNMTKEEIAEEIAEQKKLETELMASRLVMIIMAGLALFAVVRITAFFVHLFIHVYQVWGVR